MYRESLGGPDGTRGARAVIIHADDVGMCHGANAAFEALIPLGVMTSASIMVPCPWFVEAVDICQRQPDADVGVHITLTSEWRAYRWRPISTSSASSGLLDRDGYLPQSVEELFGQMDPGAAVEEMRAQVERAKESGLAITHIDTHMGAVMHPLLLPAYAQLAIDFCVPIMLPYPDPEMVKAHQIPPVAVLVAQQQRRRLMDLSIPLIDHVRSGPAAYSGPTDDFCRAIDALPAGITHFYFHPCLAGDEIEAITPRWRTRVGDYEAASSRHVRDHLANTGIHLMGYRQLAARMDQACG